MDAGVLFHIVNDHLGTPKEMFSEGGDLVWSVDHDTWGTVRRVSGAKRTTGRGDYWVENVAHSVSETPEPAAMLCPIRFQGQWENAESGLYYNRFRYYEPLAGQYLSSDPIGILGGYRPWGYVESIGLWVDPWGLAPCGPPKGPLKWNGPIDADGCCRKGHVLKHGVDDATKRLHGVFDANPLNATRQAWQIAKDLGISPVQHGSRWIYTVPFPAAGVQGGSSGSGSTLGTVKIVVGSDCNTIVTAYPE